MIWKRKPKPKPRTRSSLDRFYLHFEELPSFDKIKVMIAEHRRKKNKKTSK